MGPARVDTALWGASRIPTHFRGMKSITLLLLACAAADAAGPACSSGIDDDVDTQQCFGWCNPITADAHCEFCKVWAGAAFPHLRELARRRLTRPRVCSREAFPHLRDSLRVAP